MRLTCENLTDVLKRAISVPNEILSDPPLKKE